MLRSAKDMLGCKVHAADGKIGDVEDVYFEDLGWTVRYVVVDTGNWLPGRLVLISPLSVALGEQDWSKQVLPVCLTKEQVEKSPSADADKPVSRQHEIELNEYYGWPVYWPTFPAAVLQGEMRPAAASRGGKDGFGKEEGDPHLRSMKVLKGYYIEAEDGEIGHVEDFIVDTEDWTVRYMVVDTRNWLPERKVLVAPAWVKAVKWGDKKVQVEFPRETIRESPEFDPSQPVNRKYEARLYDYYGRSSYW